MKGVKMPHIGQVAKMRAMKIITAPRVITGTNPFYSCSKSISLPKIHGPYTVKYTRIAISKPKAARATVKKNELTSGFSHSCLKKFVL